jgi:hypothetical protein
MIRWIFGSSGSLKNGPALYPDHLDLETSFATQYTFITSFFRSFGSLNHQILLICTHTQQRHMVSLRQELPDHRLIWYLQDGIEAISTTGAEMLAFTVALTLYGGVFRP